MRGARRTLAGLLASIAIVAGMLAVATPATAAGGDPQQNQAKYYAKLSARAATEGISSPTAGTDAPGVQAAVAATSNPVVASAFTAGDLMSDAVFYNGTAWNAAQVQTFLNSQVPTCRSGYTCLKSYSESTLGLSHDLCNYTGASSETAAQIIARVGAACGINPQVLITLLQKEQGLVTDTWPSQTQYDQATGWLCPDTSACDSSSAGFFKQVLGAAWQFIQYGTDPSFNWYPVGQVTNILYSPDCTTSAPVAIWNKATAALYYYTPYQPDPAALANFFGTGDKCSEYGNRNFWGLFTQWFGNPTAGNTPTMTRSAGIDRYATAVSVSAAAYPASAVPVDAVYIASGTNFPDALGAAPAAAVPGRKGPLLLVAPTAIPSTVIAELKRLKPKKIYVAGGTGAVSAGVATQLRSYVAAPSDVVRLSGIDRYETSRVIAQNAFTTASTAYIATGLDFPDALSAGAAAGAHGAPVILVNGTAKTVDAKTKALLIALHVSTVKIVGGTGVVSAAYETDLKTFVTTQRLSGPGRYDTSVAVNADAFPGATPKTYLSTGLTFPDALAGAAAAGAAQSPLYVVPSTCVAAGAARSALATSPGFTLLGGTAVLGAGVAKLTICP
jgi:putative cell wall-binding protein